mmetsp:Transcript_53445/g.58040  ORF Transcript_53445/g.58040 Transcript_53445/m.58040 type:complete len:271 (+) Transcript_53445:71-883(+)
MKSLNHFLALAAITILQRNTTSDAFILPPYLPSRTNPSSLFHTNDSLPSSRVVIKSSQYGSVAPTPNDEIIREVYARWRQRYAKGDFDPVRHENFKANFLAVTARNNMERSRARQNGEIAPSPIQLNEFGDCSAGEYRQAMTQRQNNSDVSSGPTITSSTRKIQANNNRGLQPSNTIINSSTNPIKNSGIRREELSRASSQLRAVTEERRILEHELTKLEVQFEEKKKLLQNATNEEQVCNERLALREEQKRLLNDRLANGWEDESNLML